MEFLPAASRVAHAIHHEQKLANLAILMVFRRGSDVKLALRHRVEVRPGDAQDEDLLAVESTAGLRARVMALLKTSLMPSHGGVPAKVSSIQGFFHLNSLAQVLLRTLNAFQSPLFTIWCR